MVHACILTALLAFGLAVVYRASRIVNFAQADLGFLPVSLSIGLIVFFGGNTKAFQEIARGLLPRVDEMKLGERRAIAFGISAALAWGPLPAN